MISVACPETTRISTGGQIPWPRWGIMNMEAGRGGRLKNGLRESRAVPNGNSTSWGIDPGGRRTRSRITRALPRDRSAFPRYGRAHPGAGSATSEFMRDRRADAWRNLRSARPAKEPPEKAAAGKIACPTEQHGRNQRGAWIQLRTLNTRSKPAPEPLRRALP